MALLVKELLLDLLIDCVAKGGLAGDFPDADEGCERAFEGELSLGRLTPLPFLSSNFNNL